jgi:Protein of unknown function (DUF1559)
VSDPNEDITKQPADTPRRRDVTNQSPRGADADESGQVAPPPPKSKTWLYVLLGVGIPLLLCCCVISIIPLAFLGVVKVRESAARSQSQNNCKQMVLALNNIASTSTNGQIPPSYGAFPPGGPKQSFFVSLLPYIEQNYLYMSWATSGNTPVKTYIAPADPNNPGTSGLISYGSNGTLLMRPGAPPTFPGSFGGRTSEVIVVFERTAKSGATWSSSNSYLMDTNGSSSPEFTSADSWSSYGTKATALTSAGCVVGMGDGSARVVTESNAKAGWAWAMDPNNNAPLPAGW